MSATIAFQGEVQLLGWRETHNQGAQITFQLADPDDLAPFKAMTVRKGRMAGQILMCVLAEVPEGNASIPAAEAPPAKAAEALEVHGAREPNTLAQWMHTSGYFRSPRLWLAMHDAGIWTAQQHKVRLQGERCVAAGVASKPCDGDVVVHHTNPASSIDGGRRQPEAPQKPLHYWGLPVCHGHHQWAHGPGCSRGDKEFMVGVAVDRTAGAMKEAVKRHMGIASLTAITPSALRDFEDQINFRAPGPHRGS